MLKDSEGGDIYVCQPTPDALKLHPGHQEVQVLKRVLSQMDKIYICPCANAFQKCFKVQTLVKVLKEIELNLSTNARRS